MINDNNTDIVTAPVMEQYAITIAWLKDLIAGTSQANAASVTGVDSSTLGRLLNGKYNANPQGLLERIDGARRTECDRKMHQPDIGFVATDLSRIIDNVCDKARLFRHCSRLIGRPQMGKTKSLRHYAETNVNTVYIEMPTEPTTLQVAKEMCNASGVTKEPWSAYEAQQSLAGRLTCNHLILVDEVHQALYRPGKGVKGPLEWLRKLSDKIGCGMVLCATPVFSRAWRNGKDADILEQICKRGFVEYLPKVPTMRDLRLIWQQYGLVEPDAQVTPILADLAHSDGFGSICRLLSKVNYDASAAGRHISWDMFADEVQRLRQKEAKNN